MKKYVFSLGLIIASAIYVLSTNQRSIAISAPKPSPTPVAETSPTPVAPPPQQTAPSPAPAPKPKPKPTGQYADGAYTGSAADAYYGTVQVQATVSGGRLTGVTFLQYPNDRSTSRFINGQAMPYLKQEALAAQNANVDIVSGATDTSLAFQQSLGDALSQAKI